MAAADSAPRGRQRQPMRFRQGCMILGNAALGHSSLKFRPRRRGASGADGKVELTASDAEEAAAAPRPPPLPGLLPEVLRRADEIARLLLSCDPPAPAGLPGHGRILRPEAAERFVQRHRQLAATRGFEAARPRVVFHWTREENFSGIVASGLRVPDGGAGVAVAHGSSFGVGIYVSPDFRYGRELFAYGASTAFMCLALPGLQHFGRPSEGGFGLFSMEEGGYDSVVGREGQRGVDEWVFFDSDQLLPMFLVDRLGLVVAKEAANATIKVLHQPWPEDDGDEEAALTPAQDGEESEQAPATSLGAVSSRWRRRREDHVESAEIRGVSAQPEVSMPVLPESPPRAAVGRTRRWDKAAPAAEEARAAS